MAPGGKTRTKRSADDAPPFSRNSGCSNCFCKMTRTLPGSRRVLVAMDFPSAVRQIVSQRIESLAADPPHRHRRLVTGVKPAAAHRPQRPRRCRQRPVADAEKLLKLSGEKGVLEILRDKFIERQIASLSQRLKKRMVFPKKKPWRCWRRKRNNCDKYSKRLCPPPDRTPGRVSR